MSDVNDWNTTDASNNSASPDGFPEGMAYSEVNDSARAVMGAVKRMFADINGSLAAAGSADAYTLTLNSPYAAYFEGMLFTCSIPADNTGGACTINVNTIGAQSVVDNNGNNPPAGYFQAGGLYTFAYDGTNFQVLGITPEDVNVRGDMAVAGSVNLEAFSEDAVNYTNSAGTKNLDLSAATLFYTNSALAGNVTFTFDNPVASDRVTCFTLIVRGGSAVTITWPASVVWPEGAEPSWTSGLDVVSFVTWDGGTTWTGFLGGQAFS